MYELVHLQSPGHSFRFYEGKIKLSWTYEICTNAHGELQETTVEPLSLDPSQDQWCQIFRYVDWELLPLTVAFLPGSEIVFDYTEPIDSYPPEHRAAAETLRESVAAVGEPLLTYFEPKQLKMILAEIGFDEIHDERLGSLLPAT